MCHASFVFTMAAINLVAQVLRTEASPSSDANAYIIPSYGDVDILGGEIFHIAFPSSDGPFIKKEGEYIPIGWGILPSEDETIFWLKHWSFLILNKKGMEAYTIAKEEDKSLTWPIRTGLPTTWTWHKMELAEVYDEKGGWTYIEPPSKNPAPKKPCLKVVKTTPNTN